MTPGERPVWLPSGPERIFAVLHLPPDRASRPTAVLLCPPFGWDEESGHRGLAECARALAGAGYATLRIDFPGTRNSTGDRPLRRPGPWKAAVADSARWLRERTGASRLSLLGIGLGGLVAVDAIADGADVDDLVLWAVPAVGRTAIREIRIRARVIAARYPDDATPPTPGGPLEAVGYTLDADAVAEFERIRPAERPLPGAAGRRALLLGRDAMDVDARLQEHLERAGVTVESRPGPGFAVLTEEPQRSRAPAETITAMIAWLTGSDALAETTSSSNGIVHGTSVEPETADDEIAQATVEFDHGAARIRETALSLPGRAGPLFAILSEPVDTAGPICVLMLNSGSLSHAGPNRTWVEAARRWAAIGVKTVRVDFPGIGESPGDGDRLEDDAVFYEPEWIDETLGLLDALQAAGVASRFVPCGLCSGAYWSWQAAMRDDRVVGAMLLNLWSFIFSEELAAERAPGDALGRLRQQGIGRLLRRDITRERLVGAIRAVRPSRVLAGVRHEVEHGQTDQIIDALDAVRDRGVELMLMFGRGEPLSEQMEREGLLAQSDRWPQLSVRRIPTSDHMFRSLTLQHQVNGYLDECLARIRERCGAVSAE